MKAYLQLIRFRVLSFVRRYHSSSDAASFLVFGGDSLSCRLLLSKRKRGVYWYTRKVLAWRISNTLEANFCVDALNEAINRIGLPGIINSDQGGQLTFFVWADR